MLRDLWAAYSRSTDDDAELPLRYIDFAAWEADRLAGPDGDRLVAAWRSKLEGAAAPVVYPAMAARPAKPTGAGRKHEFALPEGLTARVAAVARETGSTPFIVSAAAFQALLHRVSGQVDICIGTPVQVRPLGTADLVGCFVNTVPLRTDFTGQPTFRDVLGRTRVSLASALANADLPFDRLVEELAPARGADGRPLFLTAIVHDRAELSGTASGGLSWNIECVATGGAKFDLTLGVTDQSVGWLEYSTDLYDAADADRIAGEYVNLLVAGVADPDCPIDELPVLADEEERLILGPWAGDRVERADVPRLTAFFEEQAHLTPLVIALIVGRQEISYRELNARANRLARHLRTLGVGPDTLVGVCLHRTAHLPVALLAVLKAGGAYVPLDPAYPKDRLAFMIADAAAPVLLTQQSLRDLLPVAAHVLRLDADDMRWMDESADDPPPTTGPTDLAYVLYTSGSTGRPKGVAVEHRSAIELMHWARDEFNRSELAGVLFGTSICFDLSVFELFVPLSNGGTVILVDNALRLADAPARDRVTLLNTVPSAAAELVRTKAIPASVRAVNLAGEPLPRALADVLYAIPTIESVRNLYGPTEDTTYSTWCEVTRDGSPVHIGRPLPNTTAHILDRNRRPVPVGVPGELYLGGAGLARGYLNRPELTAERFTNGSLATSRRYKTGDLCRWRLDGAIDYLGRLDHQVKVRGFRVELGEIEESLRACEGVRDAVVVAADDSAGGKRLVAYVAADGTAAAGIRDRLKLSLPEYMVPATVVALPELPRTANGKVDRMALPTPDQTVTTAAEYFAPANDAERALQTIWEAVLGVRPISVTASFEDLGGHSLLAAALVARIEARLGHLVPLDALFKAPTVRALADGIQQKLELGNGVIVPLNEAGDYPPLYLIAGAGGHVFTFQKFSRLLGDEFPAYGMKAVGVDGVERPLDRIEAIAARYLDEITQDRPRGPYVLGGYSVGGLVAFELALQMRRRGLPVAKVVAFDTFAPGYPRRRPWPVRAGIHLTNFFASGGGEKWAYLGQRMRNLRHRILTTIGLGHLDLRATPAVGGLSEWVLKRVWASLERANMRYWPAEPFDGDLVLVSAEKSEDWAATSLNDPQKGWGRWTKKPVEVIQVPAGHMEVFGEENLDLLVREMRAVIRSTRPGPVRNDD